MNWVLFFSVEGLLRRFDADVDADTDAATLELESLE